MKRSSTTKKRAISEALALDVAPLVSLFKRRSSWTHYEVVRDSPSCHNRPFWRIWPLRDNWIVHPERVLLLDSVIVTMFVAPYILLTTRLPIPVFNPLQGDIPTPWGVLLTKPLDAPRGLRRGSSIRANCPTIASPGQYSRTHRCVT